MPLKDCNEHCEGCLFGLGNPLLDVIASVTPGFLKKYELKENDQILASEKHGDLFDTMEKDFKVEYIPGGATQNAIRVANWFLASPQVATITGCIGKDNHGKILEDIVKKDGIKAIYQYTNDHKTGTCAVCVTESKGLRSLVAYLGAANHLTLEHVNTLQPYIDQACIYYMAGFPLTVCPDAMLKIGKHACEQNKILAMNISAPFLCQFFKDPMLKMIPYVDYLFANENEFSAFATENGIKSTDLKEIIEVIAKYPKENKQRPRVVVVTQGHLPTYVYKDGKLYEFPVIAIRNEDIVDTNGAGDAFVGGFLAGLVKNASLEKCVEAANYGANYILKTSGVQLNTAPTFKF